MISQKSPRKTGPRMVLKYHLRLDTPCTGRSTHKDASSSMPRDDRNMISDLPVMLKHRLLRSYSIFNACSFQTEFLLIILTSLPKC
jgi:hypothetical protein